MSALASAMASALGEALGREVRVDSTRSVSGGCINNAVRLQTSAGVFFAKSNEDALPGLFSSEAAGLSALARANCGLIVPRVLAHREPGPGEAGFIILEFLELGPRGSGFEEAFGRGLAELHSRSRAARFGFEADNYCGATPQPNAWSEDWIEFYRDRRLGFQVELARERGLLSAGDGRKLDRLLDHLDEHLSRPSAASLIHGDLWSGNLLSTRGGPGLVDPAAYYAHPEAELGMMTLFGGFSARTYDAYLEAHPLEAGWRERNTLYQLYHLLNHLNLFGSGYHGQVMGAVRRFV